MKWNAKKVNGALLQSIQSGESIPKMAKRLQTVTDMNKRAAIRNARTMVTSAENVGRVNSMNDLIKQGVNMAKEWIATLDSRTRDSHLALNGETVDVNKSFSNGLKYPGDYNGEPAEVYNCFVGETKVTSDSEIIRSYKHMYNGTLIRIKTAAGVSFTCTPNHPILTLNGWVKAESLNKGNDILVTCVGNNSATRLNPNINHGFASFDAIHKFFDKFGRKRICSLGVDFHGDIPTTNVEIITKKRFLWESINPRFIENINKFSFVHSCSSGFGNSRSVKLVSRFMSSFYGFMRCKCKALTFFWRSLCHSCIHRSREVSNGDFSLVKAKIDNIPADTIIRSELLNGLSANVFIDNIVDVEIMPETHGFVYNLQTDNGYYFVNSIIPENGGKYNGIFAIAKNCRCTLGYVYNGFNKTAQGETTPENKSTAAKTTKEAEAYLREKTGIKANYEKYTVEYANAINKEVMNAKGVFGDKLDFQYIESEYLDENMFKGSTCGVYDPDTGTIIYKPMTISEAKNISAKAYKSGQFSTDSTYHVIRHELGHAVGNYYMDNDSRIIQKIGGIRFDEFKEVAKGEDRIDYLKSDIGKKELSKKLSVYAFLNTQEFLAESVAEYLNGSPRPLAAKVVSILLKG